MRTSDSTAQFLLDLEKQAQLQAKLQEKQLLPRQLDWFTALVGNYPVQMLLLFSGVTAGILFLMR